MGDYIATFFSHFGAMSFKKKCKLFLRNLREIHRGSTDCAKLELR